MTPAYPDSYYSRTANDAARREPLSGAVEADVCVVGAGFAGLTAARELLRRGRSVVLLEARRCGWGASGRNGGFVSPGFAAGIEGVVRAVGLEHARNLYRLSVEGFQDMRETALALRLAGVDPPAGQLNLVRYPARARLQAKQAMMAEHFGRNLELWSRETVRATLDTERYHEGLFDAEAFQIHPLNYCLGLAREVEAAGGRIREESPVLGLDRDGRVQHVRTAYGSVHAQHVVLACGGYTTCVAPRLRSTILSIATYVVVTKPLGPALQRAVRFGGAIVDSRLASDYYRIVAGDRLLWGGRITARTAEPRALAATMLGDLKRVYPQLAAAEPEVAWSGLMGYAVHKMPQIGALRPGVWYCTAFGGHGTNTATLGGRLIAAAIAEGDDRYRLFAPFGLRWTGGRLGPLVAQMTYWGYQLADAWRERRRRPV